jgi:uncharacterized protein (DUF1501 family)
MGIRWHRAVGFSTTRDDQVGQGRLLPTTSVDRYAAMLARWFGMSANDISTILPNIGRFASRDLVLLG